MAEGHQSDSLAPVLRGEGWGEGPNGGDLRINVMLFEFWLLKYLMPRRQFTLRAVLAFIGLLSLFLALRRSYVFAADSPSSMIIQAWQMPALFACLTVAASLIGSAQSKFKRSVALGAIIATIVATELAVEIAEGFRRTHAYWNWSNDWPEFLTIVLHNTLIGGAIGFFVACLHNGCLRVFCARKKKAVTPA